MIKRPKQVERSQKSYLSLERYQDFAEQQFKNIYDYLDGKVLYEDLVGTNGNIVFNGLEEGGEIEIIYCRRRSNGTSVYKSTGKLPYSNGMEIALDINYYSNNTNQQSMAKIVTASSSGLTVNGENTLQGDAGGQAVTGATTNIYITKVKFYK